MIWCGTPEYAETGPSFVSGNPNATRYSTEVLQSEALPFFVQNFDILAYHQDNAPAHRSAVL